MLSLARVALVVATALTVQAQEIKMLKSLSGVSGHVSGSKFLFDETRTRFVYPQDQALIVYFEWTAPAGLHTITSVWKAPDGHVASIPSEVKIDSPGGVLAAYWNLNILADGSCRHLGSRNSRRRRPGRYP